ncbi:hypothetical protein D3C71_1383550 [compost metagenome]
MELVREYILFAVVSPVTRDARVRTGAVTQSMVELGPFVIAIQTRGQLVPHQSTTRIGESAADLPRAILHPCQVTVAVMLIPDQYVRHFTLCTHTQYNLLQPRRAYRVLQFNHSARAIRQMG